VEKRERGEGGKRILIAAVAGGAIATVCVLPGMAVLFKMFNAQGTKERYRVKQAIAAMERKGYVIRSVVKGAEKLVVTEKGKYWIRPYTAPDVHIKRPKKWDKKWRVLTFDIPESKKKVRHEISLKIKDMGMVAIQDSVFISPFPCKKEIDQLVEYYAVKECFVYMEADTIESREDLIKKFKLK